MKRRFFIGLAILTMPVIAFMFWLLASESGLRWSYQQTLNYLPTTLSLSGLSGRLIGPLSLQAIKYENHGQTVDAGQVTLDWNPWSLLQANIDISELRVESLDIALAENSEPNEKAILLPQIRLPLGLRLNDVEISSTSITRGNDGYQIRQIKADASLQADGLVISNLSMVSEKLNLSLQGSLLPREDYPHDIKLQWTATLPNGERIQSRGKINGNTRTTTITQSVEGAIQLDLALELREWLAQPNWQSDLSFKTIDTARIDSRLPPISGKLRLNASGDTLSARISGQLQADTSEIGAFKAEFELTSLQAERRFEGINFDKLKISALQGEFTANGQLNWSPTLHWDANISAAAVNPATVFPEWPGDIEAQFATSGEIRNSQLTASANISNLSGTLRDYPVSLQGQLQWQNNGLDISQLNLRSGDTRLSAQGRVSETLNLQWSIDSDNLAELYPQAQGSLKASGELGGKRESPTFKALISGKSLQLRGYKLDSLNVIADLNRISVDAVAAEASAQITIDGTLDAEYWRGQLVQADIQTRDYQNWNLKAPTAIDLSRDSLFIENACLLSKAESEICNGLELKDQLWKIGLEVSKLPLSLFSRWIPTDLQVNGLTNASANLEFDSEQITGKALLDLPQGQATYRLSNDYSEQLDYRSARLELQLRETAIEATSKITLLNGDRFEAQALLPGTSLLSINTKTQSLQANARLNTQKLSMIDAFIKPVEDLRGRLKLDFDISGTLGNPRLMGKAELKEGSLYIPAIKRRLTNIMINAHSDGQEKINYQADAQILGGKLTLNGETDLNAAAGWSSKLQLQGESLDIAKLLESKLPADTTIEGLFTTTATLQFKAPDNLTGEFEFAAPSGSLRYPLLEGEIENWQYRDVRLNLILDKQGMRGQSKFLIGDGNTLEGNLNLPRAKLLALNWDTQPIEAKAKLNFNELAIVEALVPDIDKLQGALTLGIDVSGTMTRPELAANAEIKNGSVAIPRLGLHIDQINLNGATDSDNAFKFQLNAHSGDGTLNISGTSRLDATSGWPTTLSIKGNDFEVSKIPEATVNVSPDLIVELLGRTINVHGDLLVPYAKLQPKDITTAAQVSNDTVIIDSTEKPESRWLITSRVNLILGDRVNFFGFGFEGQLGGNLFIEEESGQFTRGTGEIKVPQGRYRAYGQRLDIENGRLLFTGGPITNPGLDMRAVRKTGSVTAGIQVAGRLKQPRLTLFSIPAMGQTDTLSYILFGRPMETTGGDDGAMMAQAALALGLAGGDQLARTIGDQFGLDEMRVESNDNGDQAALVVGRYLSPKLYVSYGVGLIGSLNTLNLRYTISEQWQLKAESGESHGADLMYTFER